jgi:hypothetical protein
VARIAPDLIVLTKKPAYSPEKSMNFQQLISTWDRLSTSNLTPAIQKKLKFSDFVDSQPSDVLEKSTKKNKAWCLTPDWTPSLKKSKVYQYPPITNLVPKKIISFVKIVKKL